jgi:hypothetical protein
MTSGTVPGPLGEGLSPWRSGLGSVRLENRSNIEPNWVPIVDVDTRTRHGPVSHVDVRTPHGPVLHVLSAFEVVQSLSLPLSVQRWPRSGLDMSGSEEDMESRRERGQG